MSQTISTIAFVNYAYLPIARNWLAGLGRLDVRDITFVCLDVRSYLIFLFSGYRCVFRATGRRDLSKVWRLRMEFLRGKLAEGHTILLSDVDTVWLKDPRVLLLEDEESDIIVSRGFQKPYVESLGFSACLGFLYLRSTEASLAFLDRVLGQYWMGDDQRSFNEALVGEEWISKKKKEGGVLCTSAALQVRILPFTVVQRGEHKEMGAYVVHPFSDKNRGSMESTLREQGLWEL